VRPAFLHVLQALPSQATIVSPAALLRHVSSTRAIQQEGAGSVEEPWNQDLLQALLAAIYKVSMLLIGPHNVSCLFDHAAEMRMIRWLAVLRINSQQYSGDCQGTCNIDNSLHTFHKFSVL
jgi:hypothetical protein